MDFTYKIMPIGQRNQFKNQGIELYLTVTRNSTKFKINKTILTLSL